MVTAKQRVAVLAMASCALLAAAAASRSAAGGPGAPQKGKAAGGAQVAAGKRVYEANKCASCHMTAGSGGKVGPDLTKTGAKPGHTVAWFKAEVANPKSHNPKSKMPAYGERIKGADMSALAVYLSSLKH